MLRKKLVQTSEGGSLIHQMGVLPFGGTLKGWKNGQRRTSLSSTKENATSETCGGINPCTGTNQGTRLQNT